MRVFSSNLREQQLGGILTQMRDRINPDHLAFFAGTVLVGAVTVSLLNIYKVFS